MVESLSPKNHSGGQKGTLRLVCHLCSKKIKGHAICAQCSVLIHQAGQYADTETGSDVTGSADGVVCLGCRDRGLQRNSVSPRLNMSCSVCLARTRSSNVPKNWRVGPVGELFCKDCAPADVDVGDQPQRPASIHSRADELLEELGRRRKRKRLKHAPVVVFRHY